MIYHENDLTVLSFVFFFPRVYCYEQEEGE
jgi:hypothetical protein